MKYLLAFIVAIASRGGAVRVDPVRKVNEFFKIIKGNDDVYSRTAFHDGSEISINDFFEISNPKMLQDDNVDATGLMLEYNINEALHLLNTVLSCEYCDALHYFVKVSDEAFFGFSQITTKYKKYVDMNLSKVLERYKDFQTRLYKTTLETVESMILTLTYLQNQTDDIPVSKGQDILKVLLSWYAFVKNDIENDPPQNVSVDALAERFKNLTSVHLQVGMYLEQFNVKHCRRFRDYDEFKVDVKMYISKSIVIDDNEINAVDKLVAQKVDELKLLVYSPTGAAADWFVFCPNGNYFNSVLQLITRSMSSPPTMLWDGENISIEIVHTTAVANSADTQTVLRFEHGLVHTITKILVRHILNAVTDIVMENNVSDQKRKCFENVHSPLDKYTRILEDFGQPAFLINNMVVISKDVWLICYDLNDFQTNNTGVRTHIKNLEALAVNITVRNMKLDDYLIALSKTLVCAKLHPALSNLLWDKVFYTHSTVSDYAVDFKVLSTRRTSSAINNKVRCATVSNATQNVKLLEKRIDECELLVGQGSYDSVKLAVDALYALCESLRVDIVSAVERCSGDCDLWHRTLLTVASFQANIGQLKSDGAWDMMFNDRIRVLRHFCHDVRTFLEVRDSVYRCEYEQSSGNHYWQARDGVVSSLGYEDLDEDEFGDMLKRSTDSTLAEIHAFQDYFQSYVDYVQNLFDNEIIISCDQFHMLWYGAHRTMYEVHETRKRYPFDRQDGYSFQMLTVKWMYAMVFARIWDILGDMAVFSYKLVSFELETLVEILMHFYNYLPLYMYRVPNYDILRFTLILKHFDGTNVDELLTFRRVVEDELRFFGVLLDTVPNVKNTISDRILSLVALVKVLVQAYEDSAKSKIEKAVNTMEFDSANILFF